MSRRINDFENRISKGRLGQMRIEFLGNEICYFDGCKGIGEYSENMVKIDGKYNFVTVFGNNLKVEFMQERRIGISGVINNVEFSA